MDSKKKKQQYLYKEVVEKGYEPNEFANFLQAEREDGRLKFDLR